jgi:methionine salvage enolase-phosphatase E1
MEDFQKSIKQDYDILVTHKEYAAKTKYSLEELTAQLSEARVPVDSTDINTLVPGYFDKWISARNELNSYLKGSQATSYQNATRDIIEEYLRSPDDDSDDDSDDDTYDL